MNLIDETAKTLLKVDERQIVLAVDVLHDVWAKKGMVFTCGNGGNSATASHLASDLRKWSSSFTLKTICLNDNAPLLTAIANDDGFDEIYQKQLLGFSESLEDVVVAFSVHGGEGRSENILNLFRKAKENGRRRISFTGHDGGDLKRLSTVNINVPSESTPIIEGLHSVLAHIVAEELGKRIEIDTKGRSENIL